MRHSGHEHISSVCVCVCTRWGGGLAGTGNVEEGIRKHVSPLLESHLQLTSLSSNLPLGLTHTTKHTAKYQVISHGRTRLPVGVIYQTITAPGIRNHESIGEKPSSERALVSCIRRSRRLVAVLAPSPAPSTSLIGQGEPPHPAKDSQSRHC